MATLRVKLFNDKNLIEGLDIKNDVIFRCFMVCYGSFQRVFLKKRDWLLGFFREIRGLGLVWGGEARVKFHDIS